MTAKDLDRQINTMMYQDMVQVLDTSLDLAPPNYRHREVLERLSGSSGLRRRIRWNMIEHPGQVTWVWIIGEPTSGKLTVEGQLAADLLYDGYTRESLLKIDKEPKIHCLAYGRCLGELKDNRRLLTSNWGEFSKTEHQKTSRFLRDVLIKKTTDLIDNEPDYAHVILIETVAVTDTDLDLGTSAITAFPTANNFMIMLATNEVVSKEALELRNRLSSLATDIDFTEEYQKRGIIIDEEFSPKTILHEMAGSHFVEQVRIIVNHRISESFGYSLEELERNPSFRAVALTKYLNGLRRKWRIPEKHYLIAENTPTKPVHYNRKLIDNLSVSLGDFPDPN